MSVATSPTRLLWRRFLRHRLAEMSLVFIVILLILSLTAARRAVVGVGPSAVLAFASAQ